MAFQFTKRTTAVIAATAVVMLGTVGIVSAMSDDSSPVGAAGSSTSGRPNSTSTAGAHEMDAHEKDTHDSGSHDDHTGTTSADGSTTTHGGHDSGSHDDHTGTTSADGSTTTHGGHDSGSHDDHTGTTSADGSTTIHRGHDDHTNTTVGGNGSTNTTHGGHDHGSTTTVKASGGTTTTHGGHNHGTTTTQNHGSTTTGNGGTTTTHDHNSGPVIQYADLPSDVRAQVDLGSQAALRHPTTADASAAGWAQATVFFPGIAAHYLQSGWLDSTFDPARPEVLLYGADGQLVGFNYIVYNGSTPPEGFAGSADSWHEHPALCRSLTTGLIIGGEDLSQAECAAIGGVSFSFAGFYLLHVWTVPGYTSPEGVFSHENSLIR